MFRFRSSAVALVAMALMIAMAIALAPALPANAADHVIFGREVLPERHPLASRLAHRELADNRSTIIDRVPRSHLGAALAGPRHRQHVLIRRRGRSRAGFVLREIAGERIGTHRGAADGHCDPESVKDYCKSVKCHGSPIFW